MTRQRYDIHLNLPQGDVVRAAQCVIEEQDARVRRIGFRYDGEYLASHCAMPLDPVQLPLTVTEKTFDCDGGIPAFLDDYLPGRWGRRVLTRLAMIRDQRALNANSVIEALQLLGASRIGALLILPRDRPARFTLGHPLEDLTRAERLAQQIDNDSFTPDSVDEPDLVYLAHSGSGVGGARPKALVYDGEHGYVAKFNRLAGDSFNHARVELAMSKLAAAAGMDVAQGQVLRGINGREVVLFERFDITPEKGRFHLVSVSGLLKDPKSQRDFGLPFRYDDVHSLLVRHSVDVRADLEQLLKIMMFNRSINNTDDHERNFSLINRGDGYRLSPAYDFVPSLKLGGYHAAGFGYRPNPPSPREAIKLGRIFGLSKMDVKRCAEQVADAVGRWREAALEAGVSETDYERIGERLSIWQR